MASTTNNHETNKKRSLLVDFTVDITAAFGAAVLVAPFISMIDMAIIQNASGAKKLKASLIDSLKELVLQPWKFAQRRSYHLVTGVYFFTYVAANTTDSLCSSWKRDSKIPKFIVTSVVNGGVGVAKDRAFTRMFGLKPPSGLPWGTYGLFAMRDAMTIFASFTVPPILGRKIESSLGYSPETSINVAQLTSPLIVQFFSTPLHLSGLDLYNNPQHTWGERFQFVRKEYLKSAFARMGRIFPAFGIGGVVNRKLRNSINPMGPPPIYLSGYGSSFK
jgi:hypothetical protein